MSIIVFRDGIIASDGLLATSHWSIHTESLQKIFKLPDGSVIGGVGVCPSFFPSSIAFVRISRPRSRQSILSSQSCRPEAIPAT
jgi:hypothetical protein